MYLIDTTYFSQDLQVPNAEESLDINNNDNSFDIYIDKYARLLLQKALGFELFEELNENITNGDIVGTAPLKWLNLVNGCSYTFSGKDYRWKGLRFTEGGFKGSVLAHYVYYYWHLDQLTTMSAFGEVKGSAVNSVTANSTNKSIKVWNEFLKMYQGVTTDINLKVSLRNGVPFYDYFDGDNDDYVCLLTFLSHNNTDYPNAKLKNVGGIKNSLGL